MPVTEVMRATLRVLEMAHALDPDVVTEALVRESKMAEADATAAYHDFVHAVDDDARASALTRFRRSLAWGAMITASASANFNRTESHS